MEIVKIDPFQFVGIAVRTSNAHGQAVKDIGVLWARFVNEEIMSKIPYKVDDTIYAVYTDYESDHTGYYTAVLGCRITKSDMIPEGMICKKIEGGSYQKYTAKGDLTKNAVVEVWSEIWASDVKRAYTADFEVYGEKASDPTNGEADIFIAL